MTIDLTAEARKGFDAARFDNIVPQENPYIFSSPSWAGWLIGYWAGYTKRPMPMHVRPSRGDTFHLNGGKVRLVYGNCGADVLEHH